MSPPAHHATWLGSDRLLARTLAQPINRFLHIEASGGLILVAAAVVALVWVNSPWDASYASLWGTEIGLDVGGHVLVEDLRHWVNDGLMALFFFVIGLEIKSELTTGDLRAPARAAIPVIGAVGGMVVPALRVPGGERRRPRRTRLGHPDGHRRGVRPRCARAARLQRPPRAQGAAPGAGDRRRHRGHHRDRAVLLVHDRPQLAGGRRRGVVGHRRAASSRGSLPARVRGLRTGDLVDDLRVRGARRRSPASYSA